MGWSLLKVHGDSALALRAIKALHEHGYNCSVFGTPLAMVLP